MIRKNLIAMIAGTIIAIVLILALTIRTIPDSDLNQQKIENSDNLPNLNDGSLSIELVAEGLDSPTSMRFLDASNILVLQKNDGKVRLISDALLLDEPVLEVNVANEAERGLLGIAISNSDGSGNQQQNSTVFLYLTEIVGNSPDDESNELRNRVYKYTYDWEDKVLSNPALILDLPGEPGPFHNGGKIAIGPHDGRLYAVIGDVNAGGGVLDNEFGGREPDDKSVILRVDQGTGLPLEDNPFYRNQSGGGTEKLGSYYAYGIRNGFGLDFDPISHHLWMTENGEDTYDEINFVRPGLNSGWHKVMGPIARTNVTIENDLITIDRAKYEDPVFSWYDTIGVTDIAFVDSGMLGEKYKNNILVGDINNGNLYFFEVNEERTGLQFHDSRLSDLVADPVPDDSPSEVSSVLLGTGFGRITDIEIGPDGLVYVLTYEDGKIYRISKGAST